MTTAEISEYNNKYKIALDLIDQYRAYKELAEAMIEKQGIIIEKQGARIAELESQVKAQADIMQAQLKLQAIADMEKESEVVE